MIGIQRKTGILLWLLPVVALGQQQLPQLPYSADELRAPTSPAFTILNVAPTNVVRPSTPREVALEILSATERSSGDLPSNLAVEFSPYWLVNQAEVTFEDYYNPKNIGQTIARSLSVSMGTSDIPDPAIEGTSAALGVRFHLVPGKAAPGLEDKVNALKSLQLDFLDACVPDIPDEEGGEEEITASGCTVVGGEIIGADEAFLAKLRQAGNAVREADRQRVGWVVEAAFAAAMDFPDDTASDGKLRSWGAWITGSYRVRDPDALSLLGVGRYIQDRRSGQNVDMFDLGGRLIWTATEPRLSLSLETVYRDIENGSSSTSVLGVLELPIGDLLGVTASYGRGLATPITDSELVATVSLNFGFGKGPTMMLPGASGQ